MMTAARIRKIFLISISVLWLTEAWALNEAAQTFTLDGKLYQSGTSNPLLDSSAKITVQVIDPSGKCVLYEEEQTVNTQSSQGYFHINVGSNTGATKRTVNDPGRTMAQIFQNMSPIAANNVSGQTCPGSSYSPAAGATRNFRITVTPSATNTPDILTPDVVIDSVPQALVAQSVQGLEKTNILQVNNSGATALTQVNLEALFTTPAYTNLQSILAGNFMKTDSSGAALPSYAADPAGASNGDIWFDSTTGQIKYQNSGGVQVVGASGGSGGISALTVGSSMSINGTVAGTISGSATGTIDLSNTGVGAGIYSKVTVDAKGRVTAGTVSLVEADIPTLTTAGKVSGNTITSGTISGSTAINTSGNIITNGIVSGANVQATNLRLYDGSFYVQLTAPPIFANVNLTLPADDGNAGDVLSTDGSGVLSWVPAGSTSIGGDVSGATSSTIVQKIQGKAVTAGSVSGQLMIYNGTSWVNSVVSGAGTLDYAGNLSLNTVPVSKGGTGATSFNPNRMIVSNLTGSALTDFTCSLNQVVSFNGLGAVTCANISSLGGVILIGGNSIGADVSLGTNDNKALQFKTNNATAMTISQSGNVGIGTTSPSFKLDTRSNGVNVVTSIGAGAAGSEGAFIAGSSQGTLAAPTATQLGDELGNFGFVGYGATGYTATSRAYVAARATENWTDSAQGTSLHLGTTDIGGTIPIDRVTILSNGNVGVGNPAPAAALDVQGQIRASPSDVTGGTTVNWNNGNIQYTSDSCQNYTFNNVIDGASYTFVVKGATSAQCAFTAAGLAFHFTPANTLTNANSHTVFTFFRAGSDVYVSWTTGL